MSLKPRNINSVRSEYLSVRDGPIGPIADAHEGEFNGGAEEDLYGFDLSRLPPRLYSAIQADTNSIRADLFVLLCAQKGQAGELEIVDTWGERYKGAGKIRMALLSKLKDGREYKAML